MNKVYFTQILNSDVEQTLTGHVEFSDLGDTVWYDDLIGVATSVCPPISDEFQEAIADFDLAGWIAPFGEDEFGIYEFDKFTLLINPQEVEETLLSTLIHCGNGYDDCAWTGVLPRESVQDLLVKLGHTWSHYIKISNQCAFVKCHIDGYVNHRLMKIHYGDSEIANAVEQIIHRMDGISFEDRRCAEEE